MKYCAFLRGVNVKGTNMKMSDVSQVFKDAGVTDVTSVLASGNIVFSSDKAPASLKQLLEESMSAYFSYEAFCSSDHRKKWNCCRQIFLLKYIQTSMSMLL